MMISSLKERMTEFAGWVGVLSIILAYGLLSTGVLDQHTIWYHLLNILGGVGIIIDAVADKNYQPAVLNIIWIGIALYAMSSILM